MDGNVKRESPDSSAQSKSPRTLRHSMHGNRETSGASAPETAADRREKAQGRTTCMHAPEESDRGVVPKSRPNNEAYKPRRRARREDLGSRRTPARPTPV